MATMTLSLPEPVQEWVEAEAQSAGFDDVESYLLDLIRRDQERVATTAELQRIVDNALKSGTSDKSPNELLMEARRRAGQPSAHDL